MGILSSTSNTIIRTLDTITHTMDSAYKVVDVMNNKADLYHKHTTAVDASRGALNTMDELEAIRQEIGDDPVRQKMFERILKERKHTSVLIAEETE